MMKILIYYCYVGNAPKDIAQKFVEERTTLFLEKFPQFKNQLIVLAQREGSGDRIEMIDMTLPPPSYTPSLSGGITPNPLYPGFTTFTGGGGLGGGAGGYGVSTTTDPTKATFGSYGSFIASNVVTYPTYDTTDVACVNCGADPVVGYVDTTAGGMRDANIGGTVGTVGNRCDTSAPNPLGENIIDFPPK